MNSSRAIFWHSIVNFFQENTYIDIYGLGHNTDILTNILKYRYPGLWDKVRFIVVSHSDGVFTYRGKSVVSLSKLDTYEHVGILICAQKLVGKEIEGILHNRGIQNTYRLDTELMRALYYQMFYDKPLDPYKIFVWNYNGLGYGDNAKYVVQAIHRRCRSVRFIWAVRSEKEYVPEFIQPVILGSERYYYELATAAVWLNNTRLSSDINKREGQLYIQLWHGAAPFKRVEKDVVDHLSTSYVQNAKRDSELIDLFVAGSSFYTNLIKKSFWYNGEILRGGVPRTDVFAHIDTAKRKIRKKYHIPEAYKILLYAPTFRKIYQPDSYDLNIERIRQAVEKRFFCKCVVCVSRHAENLNVHYPFEGKCSFIDVGKYPDFEEILASADWLISDYSGCIYDYSISERPVFLLQKDRIEYLQDRNFYIDFSNLPYPVSMNNEGLVTNILNFDYNKYKKGINGFLNDMGNYKLFHSSNFIANEILKKMGGQNVENNFKI